MSQADDILDMEATNGAHVVSDNARASNWRRDHAECCSCSIANRMADAEWFGGRRCGIGYRLQHPASAEGWRREGPRPDCTGCGCDDGRRVGQRPECEQGEHYRHRASQPLRPEERAAGRGYAQVARRVVSGVAHRLTSAPDSLRGRNKRMTRTRAPVPTPRFPRGATARAMPAMRTPANLRGGLRPPRLSLSFAPAVRVSPPPIGRRERVCAVMADPASLWGSRAHPAPIHYSRAHSPNRLPVIRLFVASAHPNPSPCLAGFVHEPSERNTGHASRREG